MADNVKRESEKIGLADRYERDRIGGAFDAKTGVKTDGSNSNAIGDSLSDTTYTTTKGFKIKMAQGQTEFKDVNGESSRQLSKYIKGFNNRRYTDGSFSR